MVVINMFKADDTRLYKAEAFYTPKASNIQQDCKNCETHSQADRKRPTNPQKVILKI